SPAFQAQKQAKVNDVLDKLY
nr:RecName: Full=Hemocyanin subunit 6 [Homarus americanus]